MASIISPGRRFRQLLHEETPLQIVGAVNAYAGLLAEQAGFKALYVSGAGVANASLGVPDLGISSCADVLTDVSRLAQCSNAPILVDIDTGWGTAFNIARAIKQLQQAGAAAVHIEDQVQAKRCGHRPNKHIVTCQEMCDRIKAAVDARVDSDFVIMARTDALANEGWAATQQRINAYQEAGADMIFPDAVRNLQDYQSLTTACTLPLLANITEFGQTPLFSLQELRSVGIAMVLYPLSAFRAMSQAAAAVYTAIKSEGGQNKVLDLMQTRDQLYDTLQYHHYEQQLDAMQDNEQ